MIFSPEPAFPPECGQRASSLLLYLFEHSTPFDLSMLIDKSRQTKLHAQRPLSEGKSFKQYLDIILFVTVDLKYVLYFYQICHIEEL